MATGEKTFSSEGRQVHVFKSTPFKQGDYDMKLMNDAETRTKPGEGNLPYINVSFEAQGTAEKEGQKNRRVFHRFFLDTTPSSKDGVAMVDRGNGIVAFAAAASQPLSVSLVARKKGVGEDAQEVDILGPKGTVAYLKALEGTIVRAHVKVVAGTEADPERGTQGYPAKNEVAYFILPEDAGELEGSPGAAAGSSQGEEEEQPAGATAVDSEDEEVPQPLAKQPAKPVNGKQTQPAKPAVKPLAKQPAKRAGKR